MSSVTATRTTRFAPPAPPTRKRAPRRVVVGHGSSVVGRADRPVLRIVADDEGAPVLTRVSPAFTPVCEPVDAPLRRVALDDFFVAEYDGDDQRLKVAASPAAAVRLTRRGRLAVFVLGLAMTLGLGLYAASVSTANDHPEQTREVTVQPGQTLWDISSGAAAHTGGGDVRSMMSHLEAINHLDSSTLKAGQHLHVPR